jgi:hypothetical protein
MIEDKIIAAVVDYIIILYCVHGAHAFTLKYNDLHLLYVIIILDDIVSHQVDYQIFIF